MEAAPFGKKNYGQPDPIGSDRLEPLFFQPSTIGGASSQWDVLLGQGRQNLPEASGTDGPTRVGLIPADKETVDTQYRICPPQRVAANLCQHRIEEWCVHNRTVMDSG